MYNLAFWKFGAVMVVIVWLLDLPLILWVRISIRARCTTLCDKVCQWLATGQWFSPVLPVSSTNKSDHHDIAEILFSDVKHHQTNKLFGNSYLWQRV